MRNCKIRRGALLKSFIAIAGVLAFSSSAFADCLGQMQEGRPDPQMCVREATNGEASAMLVLGVMYLNGIGVDQSARLALGWLEEGGHKGHNRAQTMLGTIYASGQLDGRPNFVEAEKWFSKAAASGDPDACYHLATIYLNVLDKPEKGYLYLSKADRLINLGVTPVLDKELVSEVKTMLGNIMPNDLRLSIEKTAISEVSKLRCVNDGRVFHPLEAIECD